MGLMVKSFCGPISWVGVAARWLPGPQGPSGGQTLFPLYSPSLSGPWVLGHLGKPILGPRDPSGILKKHKVPETLETQGPRGHQGLQGRSQEWPVLRKPGEAPVEARGGQS